jgi:hypothetical protein
MWVLDGIIAGLIAGIFMGILSQLGYWFGVIRSHLIVVDGAFALRMLRRDALRMLRRDGGTPATYAVGIIIHLVTSIVFGIVYVAIAQLAGFTLQWFVAVAVYVFILWLAMLIVALPIAGQGFMGNKIRGAVWLEQLILHVIFGFSFWWALGIV